MTSVVSVPDFEIPTVIQGFGDNAQYLARDIVSFSPNHVSL